MCVAEALLRIPDAATADRLIRDKLSRGDWHKHLGQSPSMLVNASTWGLHAHRRADALDPFVLSLSKDEQELVTARSSSRVRP